MQHWPDSLGDNSVVDILIQGLTGVCGCHRMDCNKALSVVGQGGGGAKCVAANYAFLLLAGADDIPCGNLDKSTQNGARV